MWIQLMSPAERGAGRARQLQQVAKALHKNIVAQNLQEEHFVVEIVNGYYPDIVTLRESGIEVVQVGKP